MQIRQIALAALLLLGAVAPGAAQVALEVRGGAAVGNHRAALSGLELVPGASYGAGIEGRAHRWLSLYAAYTSATFGCEEGFCAEREPTFTSSGLSGGLRLHPPGLPWLRAGVVRHALRIDAEGERTAYGAELGYETALGATLPLGPRLRLLPGVFYRTHPDQAEGDSRTSVVGAELALQLRFGR